MRSLRSTALQTRAPSSSFPAAGWPFLLRVARLETHYYSQERAPRGGRQVHARLCLTGAKRKNILIAAIPPMRSCDVALPIRTSPPKQKFENQAKFNKLQCYDIPSNLYTCCRRGEILPAGIALLLEKHCDNFWL